MKIRQAKKLLMRPWNKMPKSWIIRLVESGASFSDHRYEKAAIVIRRWRKNKCKQQ